MIRVAFGHKARSGKDTAAAYCASRYDGKVLHFSDPIYRAMYAIQDELDQRREKDAPLLQIIGSHYRQKDRDFWVKQLSIPAGSSCFVADMRYPNEAAYLKERGFLLVQIVRDEKLKGDIGRDPNHISETAMDGYHYDVVIRNDGTVEELYKKIDEMIDTHFN